MSRQIKSLFTEMYIEELSVKHTLNEWSSNQKELIMFVQHTHTTDLSI